MHQEIYKRFSRQKTEKKQSDPLIIAATGRPVRDNVRKSLSKACRRAKIQNIGIHTLRHSFAVNCLLSGVSLGTVKDVLGHSRISVTSIYLQYTPQIVARELKKLPVLE